MKPFPHHFLSLIHIFYLLVLCNILRVGVIPFYRMGWPALCHSSLHPVGWPAQKYPGRHPSTKTEELYSEKSFHRNFRFRFNRIITGFIFRRKRVPEIHYPTDFRWRFYHKICAGNIFFRWKYFEFLFVLLIYWHITCHKHIL